MHALFITAKALPPARTNATVSAINSLLDAAGASIVEGPNTDGLYHLTIRNENPEGRDLAYRTLRASAAIKLVLPEK